MSIADNLITFKQHLEGSSCKLIAVSKTYPPEKILEAYELGQRLFGENKVQEMVSKQETLPKDIQWHQIGHLQSNKVKMIIPFVSLIHSIDSLKLLQEVDKQAGKVNRVISCLLQVFIAKEETKFGFSFDELDSLFTNQDFLELKNVKITGLMGMATNTEDQELIRSEFKSLKGYFEKIKTSIQIPLVDFQEISMGMSSDYLIAIEEGSTFIRVGSAIFGKRTYPLLS